MLWGSVSELHVCLAQWRGARKCVIVTSAWWALPVRPARCLTGSPWACLSVQPTRLLLFPAQCYVLLSKYVREKKNLSVHLSVSRVISPLAGARVLGFGLRAVFAQSLSISQIFKEQPMAVALCWICMMVYSVYMIYIFMASPYMNKYQHWNAGNDAQFNSMEPFFTTLVTFLNLLSKQKPLMVSSRKQVIFIN